MPISSILTDILHISSVSGDESRMASFLKDYVLQRRNYWKVAPQLFFGDFLQDNLVLCFGNPHTAIFSHIDTVGFMARYENQLTTVGGAEVIDGDILSGEDDMGPIRCKTVISGDSLFHDFPRTIERGTILTYEQNVTERNGFLEAAFLDNRLGIYNALKLCERLENGVVVFSTFEELGGSSIPMLAKFVYEKWGIRNALVSDVTWPTEGVRQGGGAVISLRDANIPRRAFLNKIVELATSSGVPYQLEVEGYGSSDGGSIQWSPYPIDWCFVGVAVENMHTPREKVMLTDLEAMWALYEYLMRKL